MERVSLCRRPGAPCDPPPATRHACGACMRRSCRLAETRPKTLAHAEVAHAVEQGLMYAATCLTAADAPADMAAKQHHAAIIVRLEEVLAEHLSRPLHLAELCSLIGKAMEDRPC